MNYNHLELRFLSKIKLHCYIIVMSDLEIIMLNLFFIENQSIDDIKIILNNKYSTNAIEDIIESFRKNITTCTS
jgi:hypothetical protein